MPAVTSLFAGRFLQIRVGYLPEPAQHVLVNRFIPVEKTGAAECHRAGVAENLPLPLRCLYRERRTSAIYQLAFDKAAIDEIKGQCLGKLMIPVICSPGVSGSTGLAAGTAL